MIRPSDLAKSGKEAGEQKAVMAWAAVARLHGFEVARTWMAGGPLPEARLPGPGRAASGRTGAGGRLGTSDPQNGSVARSVAVPELTWLHAVPNGGVRGDDARSRAIRGSQLKAEGVKPGVSDLFLPVARVGWHGFYIELKRVSKSRRSDEQIAFGEYCAEAGYAFRFCTGHIEAIDMIEQYLRS